MGILLDKLAQKRLLVSDGAWGTMLQQMGLTGGDCPEQWNVNHPDQVKSIAAAYVQAGSDLVLTNTFGGSSVKLEKFGFGDRAGEFNETGARLSLQAAPDAVVAASVGPTGELLEPYGRMTEQQIDAVFYEQIEALLRGGVRAICVESFIAIEEITIAVRAAKRLDPTVDVIATMTFDPSPAGYKTVMGVDCRRAATMLTDAGADILGSNCGNGIEQMVEIAAEFTDCTDKPILIHANAGIPQLIDGKTVFRQTPADMAGRVRDLVDAGAKIIGGCCGTTPEHITAIKAEIDKIRS